MELVQIPLSHFDYHDLHLKSIMLIKILNSLVSGRTILTNIFKKILIRNTYNYAIFSSDLWCGLPFIIDTFKSGQSRCADRHNPDTDKSPAGRKVARIRTAGKAKGWYTKNNK
jgi:hypothetical protein